MNARQVKLVNRLLDGFEGKLTNSKSAAIAKCSPDTALRDITDLLARGVLRTRPQHQLRTERRNEVERGATTRPGGQTE